MKLTGAQIIVQCLLEQGVDTVFGYPGGAVLNIYDALYEYSDKIRHVLTAHEQGAAHAADGYARASGKTGVCIATSGPGATNLVTGIATAYMDSSPIVAITGNVATPLLGRDSFQEVDITGITIPITKHNFIVKDINKLAHTIREAFRIAGSGRKGPVLIDVPKDITSATCEYEFKPAQIIEPAYTIKQKQIDIAADMINSAQRPLIYIGGGIVSSNATQELIDFVEAMDAPVCSSIMGLSGFPASHPLFLGMIGMHAPYESAKATMESDLIVVLGARFSDRVAGDREKFAPNAKIIQIDIDPAEIDKNVRTTHNVVGNLKHILPAITQKINKTKHKQWFEEINSWKRPQSDVVNSEKDLPNPYHVIDTVRGILSDEDIVVTDVGQHQIWTAQRYKINKPRTFVTSGGLGTMGFGMGAAIGSQFAHPDRRVVLFTGDGSFHMNLNELVTLASYNLPVVVIVMNNRVLGMVRQWQKLFYGRRFSQTDPKRKTDFVKVAEGYGIKGMRITCAGEVESVLKEAFEYGGPVVVDCRVSPDFNALPMIPPGMAADSIITHID